MLPKIIVSTSPSASAVHAAYEAEPGEARIFFSNTVVNKLDHIDNRPSDD